MNITQSFEAFDQPWRFLPEFFTENPLTSSHFDGGDDDAPFSINNFDPIMEGTQTYSVAPDRQGFDAVKLVDVNSSNSESFTGENPPSLGDPVYINIIKTISNGKANYDFKVQDFDDIVAYQMEIDFTSEHLQFSETQSLDLGGRHQ